MAHQDPGNTGATERGVESRCTAGAIASAAPGEPGATERGIETTRVANATAHADSETHDAPVVSTNDQGHGDPLRAGATDCSQVLRARSLVPPSPDGRTTGAAAAYDAHGNRVMTLPRWPLARPHLATRESRLQRAELRLGFAWYIQQEQHKQWLPILPPCSWCGLPTGGYCDLCVQPIANPVCSDCGGTSADIVAACRRCHDLPDVS